MEETADAEKAPVPPVEVVDADGRVVARGWYFEFPEYNPYPDQKPPRTVHGVVEYTPGDWGMQNTPRMIEVTPPHTIRQAGPEK